MTVRKTAATVAATLAAAILLSSAPQGRQGLPERYKTWLDEEVVYIITQTEKDVFLKLQTDRERELFTEAFWKQRDPTPNSPDNEFRTEHYRRINYANRYLGRQSPRPGWRTDRGRMYIILGEPMEIQRFEGKAGIYNCEVWFYQGKTEEGLPSGFYLLFYQEGGHGEAELYSPASDGPMALMTNYYGDPTDYAAAYESLREIDPTLASVSLSLIPGEDSGAFGRPSLASDLLIQRIESSAVRNVKEKYAQKFLQYKDLVEVEYTANYLESDSLIKVFRDPSGLYFVHYTIEPARLSVNAYQDKYYTTFKLNGRVTTPEGRLVYQYDKTISLDLPEQQMKEVSHAPFAIHDLFPLVPGDYNLSILLKNEISKEFMSVEQSIRIPGGSEALQMTRPLLGYKRTRLEPAEMKIKAFRVGPYQLFCQPNRVFTAKENLTVVFQLHNLTKDLKTGGEVRFSFLKDGQPFREMTRKPAEFPDLPNAFEEISLADFPPAHYQLTVAVRSGGAEIVSAAEEFDVTFAQTVARPWYSSRVLPETGDPVYAQILGAQLFNLDRLAEARVFLEKAHQMKPDSPDAAGSLAQVLVAAGESAKAVGILAPFLSREEVQKYEMYVLAGNAYRRSGAFDRAIEVLDKAVSHYGVNSSVLNLLAECHLGAGQTAEALQIFEKSLELSPDQPEIRKRIEELRKKK